jgi:hypothetical protein
MQKEGSFQKPLLGTQIIPFLILVEASKEKT